ncbi:MAG: hypothetical protein PXY39_05255 [archaeon]|nr:hypothetical protein [archaeon]
MVLGIPSIGIAKSALIGKKLDYKIGLEKLSCYDQEWDLTQHLMIIGSGVLDTA